MTVKVLLWMAIGAALAGVAFGALGLYLRGRRDRAAQQDVMGWDPPTWPRDGRRR